MSSVRFASAGDDRMCNHHHWRLSLALGLLHAGAPAERKRKELDVGRLMQKGFRVYVSR